MMPELDGYQLIREIREQQKRDVPVIMLTAKGQLEDKEKGFALGADDYMVKPFELKELLFRPHKTALIESRISKMFMQFTLLNF